MSAATRQPIDDALLHLGLPRRVGDESHWLATCPACRRAGQLHVAQAPDGRIILLCDAGCGLEEVAMRLKVQPSALYPPPYPQEVVRVLMDSSPSTLPIPDTGNGRSKGDSETPALHATAWPSPPNDRAYHGLAGDFVRAIEPHTEGDPMALLVQFLACFGNVVGRSAHYQVEAADHYCNLFAVMVGATSKGRKGTSWEQILRCFRTVVPAWSEERLWSGLSSGEGLIYQVRDPVAETEALRDKNRAVTGYQQVVKDQGENDKRLMVTEPEFASVLRVLERDGNKLSALIRQAWDSGDLRTMTKSPAQATGAHISIIGHVTKDELLRYLNRTEVGNGFANRFLWVCVQRSKELPEGGRIHEVDFNPLIHRLQAAIEFASQAGELRRDDSARAIWRGVYHALSSGKPGLFGAVTSRAEAQVVRLSALYALLDCSPVIRGEHMLAALALWDYSEASARYIFGDSVGDPTADDILHFLRDAPNGLTQNDIREKFNRNKSAQELGQALRTLTEYGLVRSESQQTGGRPATLWFATSSYAENAVSPL